VFHCWITSLILGLRDLRTQNTQVNLLFRLSQVQSTGPWFFFLSLRQQLDTTLTRVPMTRMFCCGAKNLRGLFAYRCQPPNPDSVKLPTGIEACDNANADGVLVLTPTTETATVGHCIRWATSGSLEYKTASVSLVG
jgi:hypothetical protein